MTKLYHDALPVVLRLLKAGLVPATMDKDGTVRILDTPEDQLAEYLRDPKAWHRARRRAERRPLSRIKL